MKIMNCTCDQCGKQLDHDDGADAWRITLDAERLPSAPGPRYMVATYPPLMREHHFCGTRCLREWVEGAYGVEGRKPMTEAVRIYLPWLLSGLSLAMSVLTGNKNRHAWLFGLGIQCLWLVWIFAAQAWGFLPLCIALFAIYTRNHFKWTNEAPAAAGVAIPQGDHDGSR